MKKKLISLVLLLVFVFSVPTSAAEISENNKRELIRYIYSTAISNSKSEIEALELFLDTLVKVSNADNINYDRVLKYFCQSIDEYGDYFSPEESIDVEADLTGQSGGIGASIEMRNGVIYVVNIIPGSPSEKAGVHVGHAIVKANGVDLAGMSLNEALTYIRGEVNTEIVVTFEDPYGKQYDMLLVRDIIEIASLNYAQLADYPEIGYIEITNFSMTTGEELKKALTELKSKGVKKLILDLRYNGGGMLQGAIDVAGAFLPIGKKILSVEPRNKEEQQIFYASGKMFDGDMVVLVNDYTASASEVVTGALKDHKRATVIGERTYGKGTVQNLFPLPLYGGYFKFTVAEYLTPKGTSINKVGIAPNQTVINENYKMTEEEIPHFAFMRVMRIGDSGEDVKNIKESLKILNYVLDDTDVFDQETYNAIKTFQQRMELYPYGVCDFTTQQHIKQALLDTVFYHDTQFETAVEILTE